MSNRLWMLTALVWLPAALAAEDWPQWRGPRSQGISAETNLATEWSADKIAWKATLAGTGASSPIVSKGLVIVTSQLGSYSTADGGDPRLARDDRELAVRENAIGSVRSADGKVHLVVEAFDRASGKRLWEYRIDATGERPELHEKHNLATPTPVTDGKLIYVWFGNGQAVALDREGGEVWKRHLGREHGSFVNNWGHGSSPMLYKNLVIFLVDHRPVSYLLALDAATGEQRWKVDRGSGRVSHSTPVIVDTSNGCELIVGRLCGTPAVREANADPFGGLSRRDPLFEPGLSQ